MVTSSMKTVEPLKSLWQSTSVYRTAGRGKVMCIVRVLITDTLHSWFSCDTLHFWVLCCTVQNLCVNHESASDFGVKHYILLVRTLRCTNCSILHCSLSTVISVSFPRSLSRSWDRKDAPKLWCKHNTAMFSPLVIGSTIIHKQQHHAIQQYFTHE